MSKLTVCKRLKGMIDETATKALLLSNRLMENPELLFEANVDTQITFLLEEMDKCERMVVKLRNSCL